MKEIQIAKQEGRYKMRKNCIICEKEIHRAKSKGGCFERRSSNAITCSRKCSKVYYRIYHYMYKKLNKKLKKEAK